jgi:hypothetical protein
MEIQQMFEQLLAGQARTLKKIDANREGRKAYQEKTAADRKACQEKMAADKEALLTKMKEESRQAKEELLARMDKMYDKMAKADKQEEMLTEIK